MQAQQPMQTATEGRATGPTAHFEIIPRGPYSLAASIAFLEGFAPAAYQDAARADHLHLAFVVDGRYGNDDVAGVCLHSEAETVVGDVYSSVDAESVRSQVARILSLDIDGEAFLEVGPRDPVIGRLQARYAGLRPVNFLSPYEAAAWAIISQRIRITQAARIKARMAEQLGPSLEIHGERYHAFPGPSRLRNLEGFAGLFGRKVEYLQKLAEAALQGQLNAPALLSRPWQEALKALKSLPGIGDFGAQHILLRGAGEPDFLPTAEPRMPAAIARAYDLEQEPSLAEMEAMAEAWRPFRTWVAVLLRVMLEDETHEIAGRRTPVQRPAMGV